MGSRTVGTVARSKIFVRFFQSKPHIRSTTNIKVCLWVQRQTPGCIFIPRLSRDSLHFSCFRRVAIFKKDLLSVPIGCTAFHFLALVMRRSGVRFSSRAPHCASGSRYGHPASDNRPRTPLVCGGFVKAIPLGVIFQRTVANVLQRTKSASWDVPHHHYEISSGNFRLCACSAQCMRKQ